VKNEGNIQNLFHKGQIRELLETAGYKILTEETVNAAYLRNVHFEKKGMPIAYRKS